MCLEPGKLFSQFNTYIGILVIDENPPLQLDYKFLLSSNFHKILKDLLEFLHRNSL